MMPPPIVVIQPRRDAVPGRSQNMFVNRDQARLDQRGEIRDQLIRAGKLVARIDLAIEVIVNGHRHTHTSVVLRG
jgi:hypothetical protein